jgi:GNAT superfamily N-acetyltransferase
MAPEPYAPRLASPDEAGAIAQLLHDFNREYDWPSPPVDTLATRLRMLLGGVATVAFVAGSPPVAVALVTFRPNIWYAGPVAILDEMYVVPSLRGQGIGTAVVQQMLAYARAHGAGLVEINVDEGDVDAQRFYERHGFSGVGSETGERAFYFEQEL